MEYEGKSIVWHRGYTIEEIDDDKFKVTSPNGIEWFEDSVKDAKETIDKELD